MQQRISVVIPARDSQNTIRGTLSTLFSQTRQPDEVIIVVSESDETMTALKDYTTSGRIRLLMVAPDPRFVRDAHLKRWIGALAATGDFICFIDSKVLLESDALENAMDILNRYHVDVVSGMTPAWPTQEREFLVKLQDKGLIMANPSFPYLGFLRKANFGRSESLPVTTFMLMTHRAFCSVKDDFGIQFSTMASTYDDYALSWLLVSRGYTIAITDTVVARHYHRQRWKDICTQIGRSGQSAALLTQYYPDCPFARRRIGQVRSILIAFLTLILVVISVAVTAGMTGVMFCIAAGIGLLILACVLNILEAREIVAFFFPPLTGVLVLVFIYHFLKGMVRFKGGKASTQDVAAYLQIH